jgi:hypothetical protein
MSSAYQWFYKWFTEGYGRFAPLIMLIRLFANNWDRVTASARTAWSWIAKIWNIAKNMPAVKIATTAYKAVAGKRADGGPVSRNKPYLVGERGPEVFTPQRSGSIIPNLAAGGSGGMTVNNNFIINAPGGSAAEVEQGVTDAMHKFDAMMRRWDRQNTRRSYSG